MGSKSSIEWTDATWTPLRAEDDDRKGWACVKVSEGCKNCYAETMNKRLGTRLPYAVGALAKLGARHYLDEGLLAAPLHWKKPRMVFVCSMTDLFGDWVPDEWIDRMFAVMAATPEHTYQVLTKRPARMREYVAGARYRVQQAHREIQPPAPPRHWYHAPDGPGWPLPNVWLGTSVENQDAADERIPELLDTSAALRFLSLEPLLGPVDLWSARYGRRPGLRTSAFAWGQGVRWVIAGGESGNGARRLDTDWILQLVDQCRGAAVPCFVKQMGRQPGTRDHRPGCPARRSALMACVCAFADELRWVPLRLESRKGSNPDEWPGDLRVREMPVVGR